MTKNNNKGRGRPSKWTDDELMQLALNTKYKHHGEKLTPSLLERETKVGRNTWSRRMRGFIDELNNPVLPNISTDESIDTILPSIDLIFNKYGNDKLALKNELLELEILLYDFYKELKEYKLKEEKFDKAIAEMKLLKSEIKKQEKRAKHYEKLYNDIVVSSIYPHLQEVKSSQINQHNITEKLINMEEHKEKNVSLDDLTKHFPDITGDEAQVKDSIENKQQGNMKKLLDKFDL